MQGAGRARPDELGKALGWTFTEEEMWRFSGVLHATSAAPHSMRRRPPDKGDFRGSRGKKTGAARRCRGGSIRCRRTRHTNHPTGPLATASAPRLSGGAYFQGSSSCHVAAPRSMRIASPRKGLQEGFNAGTNPCGRQVTRERELTRGTCAEGTILQEITDLGQQDFLVGRRSGSGRGLFLLLAHAVDAPDH